MMRLANFTSFFVISRTMILFFLLLFKKCPNKKEFSNSKIRRTFELTANLASEHNRLPLMQYARTIVHCLALRILTNRYNKKRFSNFFVCLKFAKKKVYRAPKLRNVKSKPFNFISIPLTGYYGYTK